MSKEKDEEGKISRWFSLNQTLGVAPLVRERKEGGEIGGVTLIKWVTSAEGGRKSLHSKGEWCC